MGDELAGVAAVVLGARKAFLFSGEEARTVPVFLVSCVWPVRSQQSRKLQLQ